MIASFEEMKVQLAEVPVGVEGMVKLQEYVETVLLSLMPDVEIQLDKTRRS